MIANLIYKDTFPTKYEMGLVERIYIYRKSVYIYTHTYNTESASVPGQNLDGKSSYIQMKRVALITITDCIDEKAKGV